MNRPLFLIAFLALLSCGRSAAEDSQETFRITFTPKVEINDCTVALMAPNGLATLKSEIEGNEIDQVNLWSDLGEGRQWVCNVKSGDRVAILKEEGQISLVRLVGQKDCWG